MSFGSSEHGSPAVKSGMRGMGRSVAKASEAGAGPSGEQLGAETPSEGEMAGVVAQHIHQGEGGHHMLNLTTLAHHLAGKPGGSQA